MLASSNQEGNGQETRCPINRPLAGCVLPVMLWFISAGKKALTLQKLEAIFESGNDDEQVSKRADSSLHASVVCKAGLRKNIERLCRLYYTSSGCSVVPIASE